MPFRGGEEGAGGEGERAGIVRKWRRETAVGEIFGCARHGEVREMSS